MATQIGTVKVPASIVITAGEGSAEIGRASFELELSLEGGSRAIGRGTHVVINPDRTKMNASIAKALREAADDIEAPR
jgi:hypothetical protein